jgi:hypothetical protein
MLEAPHPTAPASNPTDTLRRIHDWWNENRVSLVSEYESKVYPGNMRPTHLEDYGTKLGRSDWMVLLTLGSLYRMGRTMPYQHRAFIEHCQRNRWWDVFVSSDPRQKPECWLNILEEFADRQVEEATYLYWMKEFVTLHRFARWLDEYAFLFLNLSRRPQPFQLSSVLSPRADADQQGGGVDAPPLLPCLGPGAAFVVRELARFGLIAGDLVDPHCYVPTLRVRRLLAALGCELDSEHPSHPSQSQTIHDFLIHHLGRDDARFSGEYDLPFVFLTDPKRPELLSKVLGDLYFDDEDECEYDEVETDLDWGDAAPDHDDLDGEMDAEDPEDALELA